MLERTRGEQNHGTRRYWHHQELGDWTKKLPRGITVARVKDPQPVDRHVALGFACAV